MVCPFCKAEYRAGISRCSDCSFPLVSEIPKDDSNADFMVILWNGESLPFLETVCAELDRAEIPVAAPRVEVLLRDPVDRYHLRHLKTFPYVLGVFKQDFVAARNILELVTKDTFPPISLPPVGAYPEPFDESVVLARREKSQASLDTIMTICSSDDLQYIKFLETSLDGLDIPFRRVGLENGAYEVQVRPEDEGTARQVVREIASGTSSEAAAVQQEDANLQDDAPQSYFLAWFLPITYLFLLIVSGVAESGRTLDVSGVVVFGGIASWIGMVWMVYQAIRYEVRPLQYCVAALLPFTFVWYYVERYRVREGVQRLPVAVRARLHRPHAS